MRGKWKQKGNDTMRTLCGTILAAVIAFAAFGNDEKCPISENVRGHENIEWSISYAYGLTDATNGKKSGPSV